MHVQCSCGEEADVYLSNLTTGGIKRCKTCTKKYRSDKSVTGHKHPLYQTWVNMLNRCYGENTPSYRWYGGRGITVCDRWRCATGDTRGTVQGFHNFLADMGERPKGLSIDRIDNDGNYEPGNCRWATASEQQANTRRQKVKT